MTKNWTHFTQSTLMNCKNIYLLFLQISIISQTTLSRLNWMSAFLTNPYFFIITQSCRSLCCLIIVQTLQPWLTYLRNLHYARDRNHLRMFWYNIKYQFNNNNNNIIPYILIGIVSQHLLPQLPPSGPGVSMSAYKPLKKKIENLLRALMPYRSRCSCVLFAYTYGLFTTFLNSDLKYDQGTLRWSYFYMKLIYLVYICNVQGNWL